MKIKRGPIQFHNVISATFTCKHNEWHRYAREIRNDVIKSGLYGTGPVIYQVSNIHEAEQEADYTFHVPVNASVDMEENENYQFREILKYEDGLLLRHADLDEDLKDSYAHLLLSAQNYNLELQEPFYHIYLDVYGDGIIDIFAPIVKEE